MIYLAIRMFNNYLIYTAIVLLLSVVLYRVYNSVKPMKKKISNEIVRKSNWIAVLISFAIWAVQLTILGISDIFIFSALGHWILMVIFFVINWAFTLLFVKNSTKKALVEVATKMQTKKDLFESQKDSDKLVLLDVQNLVTHFYTEEGIVKAVEGVSFQIFENEVLGLVGETGCGKSVTALSILQLVRPPGKIISGRVMFEGKELLPYEIEVEDDKGDTDSIKKGKDDKKTITVQGEDILKFRGKDITMIFQDPLNSLNPVVKVGDQIMEVYLIHKEEELYAELGEFIKTMDSIKAELTISENSFKERKAEIKEFNAQMKNSLETAAKNRILNRIVEKEKEVADILVQKEEIEKRLSDVEKKANIFAIGRKWSEKIIKDVGIADPEGILDRYPHELSGGMRQRIMIAMGLACSPKLLIADEPTTALDVTIQAQILDLMKKLQEDYHTSILMITHDLGLISELCDRVAVMYSGYIVEYGSIFTLFKRPYHPYTRGLIGAIPRVEKRVDNLEIIPGMVPNLIYPPKGCRFHPRCTYCFEPCDHINPAMLEVEEGYFVACHLYDTKYKDLAEQSIKQPKKKIEEAS